MAAPERIRVVPAPLALRDRMIELTRGTFAVHNARQPYAFPQDIVDRAVQEVSQAFLQDGRPLSESPNAYIAMIGDAFAGYVLLSAWARQGAPAMPYVAVEDICVVEEFRGRGVATALLDHVKALAKDRDWDNLTATVWAWNKASEGAFRRAGFVRQAAVYRFGPDRQARSMPGVPGRWRQLGVFELAGLAVLCAFAAIGAFIVFADLFRYLRAHAGW